MITVQLATTDNAFFKPVELPLPLTHAGLLDAARKKFKAASKQSRLFDARSGAEIRADAVVKLAPGANVMVSGKAGWKGAERLRAAWELAAVAAEALAAADAAAIVPAADGERAAQPQLERASAEHEATRSPGAGGLAAPPLQLQLVSFSYDMGQPHDTAANVNARGLPNPGKAAKGLTGLDRRLAREVLASPGAADLCERVVQEALRQIQLHLAAAGAAAAGAAPAARGPPLLRVGVGCDRGLHRSVALVEAATARLVRKAEHARSGRNSPGLEVLLRRVQLVDADHRELARRGGVAGTGVEEEGGERGVDTRSELRLVVAA